MQAFKYLGFCAEGSVSLKKDLIKLLKWFKKKKNCYIFSMYFIFVYFSFFWVVGENNIISIADLSNSNTIFENQYEKKANLIYVRDVTLTSDKEAVL